MINAITDNDEEDIFEQTIFCSFQYVFSCSNIITSKNTYAP